MSAEQLADMIHHLGPDRIVPASEWVSRASVGDLAEDQICLTFDDNLRCQHDVALPVLRDFGLTAFWFISTSVMEGVLQRLEIYRAFRILCFDETNDFYEEFFRTVALSECAEEVEDALAGFQCDSYLSEHAFYSEADRRFRYVRDEVLGARRYEHIMDSLIASKGIELDELATGLWMNGEHVRDLHQSGHVIGLHTHTHPTRVAYLPPQDQFREYRENHSRLTTLLGEPPVAMSHPCNSYNAETLAILRKLGVKVGFRSNMNGGGPHSELEYPREDHAHILREMHGCVSQYSPATSPAMSH